MVRGAITEIMDKRVETQVEPEDARTVDTQSESSIRDHTELSSQRLALLFEHLPGAILANMASLCLISVILWPISPHSLLVAWTSILILISLGSGLSLYFWRRQSQAPSTTSRHWFKLFALGTVAMGLGWGISGFILVPDNAILYTCIIALWVCGLSAGAANSLAIDMRMYFSFSIPAIFPLAILLTVSGNQTEMFLASGMLLFFGLITFTALQTHKMLLANLSLQSNNRRLIEELSGDKDCIEKDNQYLRDDLQKSVTQLKEESNTRNETAITLNRYEDFVNSSNDLYAFIDPEYRYQAVNQKFLDTFDKPRDFFINRKVSEVTGENAFNETLKPNIDKALLGQTVDVEYWIDLPGVGRRYKHSHYQPHWDDKDELSGIVAIVRDMTSHQTAEESLTRSHSLFRQAEQIGKLGYWEWDEVEHRLISCSEQYAAIYEMTMDEIIADASTLEDDLRHFHPDDRQRYRETTARFQIEKTNVDIEFRIVTHSGKIVHVHERGEPVLDETGKLIRTFGTLQDITERKQAEAEQKKYQQIIDASADLNSFIDTQYVYQAVNQSYVDLFGKPKEFFLGKSVKEIAGEAAFEKEIRPLIDRAIQGETVFSEY